MRARAYFDYSANADGYEASWGMVLDLPGHLGALEAGGRLQQPAGEAQACSEAVKALHGHGIESAILVSDAQSVVSKPPSMPPGFELEATSRDNPWHRRAHDLARKVRETGEAHLKQTPITTPAEFARAEEKLLGSLEERGAVESRVRSCVTTVPQTIGQIQEASGASTGYIRLILKKMAAQGRAHVDVRGGVIHAKRIPASGETPKQPARDDKQKGGKPPSGQGSTITRPDGTAHLDVTVKGKKRRSKTINFIHVRGQKYRIGKGGRPDHQLIDVIVANHAKTPEIARWLRQQVKLALAKRR